MVHPYLIIYIAFSKLEDCSSNTLRVVVDSTPNLPSRDMNKICLLGRWYLLIKECSAELKRLDFPTPWIPHGISGKILMEAKMFNPVVVLPYRIWNGLNFSTIALWKITFAQLKLGTGGISSGETDNTGGKNADYSVHIWPMSADH